MSDRVDRHPQKPTELPTADILKTLPDEAQTPKTIFGRIIKKIGSILKWIKNKITFKNNTDILAREIDTKYAEEIATKYTEPTQETELTSLEYKNLAKTGMLRNDTLYIVTDHVVLDNTKNLPLHVKFLKSVVIMNSPELTTLPPNFTCLGDVTIQKCSNFNMKDYPKGVLDIHGKLTINKCNSFSDLPTNLNSDVHISNCTKFNQLLAGSYKNLTIEECKNFHKISSGTVTENLSLINNKKFKSFPDNLTVVNLNVISCSIESFASEITILGNLLLKSCSALRKAESPNVKLMGNITIDDCYNFVKSMYCTNWPKWICSSKADGSLREMCIYMKRKSNFVDMHVPGRVNLVYPSLQNIANGKFTFNVSSIIEFFIRYAGDQDRVFLPYIGQHLPVRESNNIRDFLSKIRETEDYQTGNRELLSQQVVKILSLLQENIDKNMQKMALDIIEDSVADCVDRTILALDDLLMLVQQKEAVESGDTEKIRDFAKHSIIISETDAMSRKKNRDQIENVLLARLEIRENFDIQVGVQSMAYSSYAKRLRLEELTSIASSVTNEAIDEYIKSGMPNRDEFSKRKIVLPAFKDLGNTKTVDTMPECCIMNDIYDEMVEYQGKYYGYNTLLKSYRNTGKDPYTQLPIDTDKIYRVVVSPNIENL